MTQFVTDNLKSVNTLANLFRNTGNTTFILNACKLNKSTIVICRNEESANDFRRQFIQMLQIENNEIDKRNVFTKFKGFVLDKLFGLKLRKKHSLNANDLPIFVGIERAVTYRGYKRPVIFDNGCLC